MRFLIDNQLPVALARWLSSRGWECLHVLDAGLAAASDSEIWRHAIEGAFVVVSKDEDFFHVAARPGSTVQLVWIRLGNCRKAELLDAMERTWPRVSACLEAGERVVEVR